MNQARSGDIILFHTNRFAAGFQRVLLSSDFDHVACVVRSDYAFDVIYLLEAVGTGVRLIKWDQIRKYIGRDDSKFFSSVSYRKVNMDRSRDFHDKFIEFANQTIGHKYSLDVPKLGRQKSIGLKWKPEEEAAVALIEEAEKIGGNHQYEKLVRDDRTFFCSELVAKALKTLEIIENDDRSCTQFYPKHFSSNCCQNDFCLKLMPGVKIDKEKEI